ncbi:MAG: glycosyltransferase family 1 protein [Phycisphaerales bacterium]|nr:glycosyltransferase family 1 protein [Phycisphaerales bacterium]
MSICDPIFKPPSACDAPDRSPASPSQRRDEDGKPAMRLCLVSQEYPPETARGGIGSQTYLKAHHLAALGHRVHVVSRGSNDGVRTYQDGSVHVTRVPGFEQHLPIYTTEVDWLTYSTQVAAAVAAIHQEHRLDLVDFPEWACEGYVHLLNQTEWNYVPTVIHLHGPLVMFGHAIGWPEIDSEFFRVGTAMEATCLRLADRVFSSSRCSAQWCSDHYGLNAAEIPILNTGVDVELFRPLDVPRDSRPTIVFVGNLSENKGVDMLVDAACAIAPEFPGLKLKLIGMGKPAAREHLHRRVGSAGLPDLLEFTGFVRREELPDHLSRAHVFAAPSGYEGGPGFVYLEAMACGLPVIACSGSGASEVVIPEKTGLLVPPHDTGALAVALRRLLGDPHGCRALGDAARQYVKHEADSRTCVRQIESFYASVVAECRATTMSDGGGRPNE